MQANNKVNLESFLYPNPANDFIYIESEEQNLNFSIQNQLGEIVFVSTLKNVDQVICGMSGSVGLAPIFAAVRSGQSVAIANIKVYANFADGFIGTGLKKDELIAEVSDLDDIIAFTKGGIMKVVRVSDKTFIGKDILHVAVFQKNDERTTYNMIYVDGKTGVSYAKRFNVTGITRDKEYDLTKGSEKSRVHYFSANANGEAEVVKIVLSPNCNAKKKELEFYFEELEIKGRGSFGNQVSHGAARLSLYN